MKINYLLEKYNLINYEIYDVNNKFINKNNKNLLIKLFKFNTIKIKKIKKKKKLMIIKMMSLKIKN